MKDYSILIDSILKLPASSDAVGMSSVVALRLQQAQALKTKKAGRIFARPFEFLQLATLRLPNHVRDGFAGGDEGDDVGGVRGDHVEDVGFVGIQHALDGGLEVLLEHDAFAFHAEGVADGHVIRIDGGAFLGVAQVGVAAVAGVEIILPLHHHAEVLVVQDDGLGGDFFDVRGGEFLNVHQEGAVAVNVNDLFVR